LPITHREQIIGVLEVLNKRGSDTFDSEDLEVLAIVASQIGIAIQNAKLYARLRQQFTLTEAELKETQARLLRSERLAALGQLSQGIAHEVRNPVTSIGGFAKRLKKALPADDPVVHYVDIILEETSRLEQMVHDLEQFTRMPKPEIRQVKLLALLQSAVKAWQTEDRSDQIEVNMETLPEDPAVFVDRALMEQALIHLLRNAHDAMPQGGVISISTSWEDKWLVLSVKDTGSGIASEELPRIFDPFFTSKTRGSGLGLTTVNRIVNEHGGEVEIFSTPGDGTEARILLPPFSQSHLT
jgi:signal transduction histidine kinase